jgi:hypothetical protein
VQSLEDVFGVIDAELLLLFLEIVMIKIEANSSSFQNREKPFPSSPCDSPRQAISAINQRFSYHLAFSRAISKQFR